MADDSLIAPIVAALSAGEPALAEQRCRATLEQVPDEPDVLVLLALGLQQQGRPHDALAVLARLVELRPEDSLHWANYAGALAGVGNLEAAERAAETAARCALNDPERLDQLGLMQLGNGKPALALATLMRAYDLAPDTVDIRLHAARACVACHDHRAEILLQPWRSWLPLADGQLAELARLLVQVNELGDGMELLEDRVRRVPGDWSAQLLLAKVYERVNRLEQARDKLQWILAATPPDAGIRREVESQQAQLAMRRRDYTTARKLLEHVGPGHANHDTHYFALAQACDRLGDVDAAMQALKTGHAIQASLLAASNPQLLEADAAPLPHVDDRLGAEDYQTWPQLKAPDTSQSPVFVVGFPRSGTTLLEQMLDAHPRLQSMDERPFMHQLANQLGDVGIEIPGDLRKLVQRDCDELRKGYVILACGKVPRRWDARLVDKNPLNMSWLPMIHRLFPKAKFVFVLRHPCDVLLSCYLQNFQAAPLVAACRSLEHLARAYVAAMDNWLYHARLLQPDVFVSRYEDLVADTPAQTRKIAQFLELGEAESMLRFAERAREKGYIRTPSYTQVVEPINSRGVDHWRQYAAYFEPILPILQPMLAHWGYADDGVTPPLTGDRGG
ncbi:MAG TPA: sulfotransferase [Rhodanobacter sp.]|nr:sulfotransferase [Rhodanobacter sp.]